MPSLHVNVILLNEEDAGLTTSGQEEEHQRRSHRRGHDHEARVLIADCSQPLGGRDQHERTADQHQEEGWHAHPSEPGGKRLSFVMPSPRSPPGRRARARSRRHRLERPVGRAAASHRRGSSLLRRVRKLIAVHRHPERRRGPWPPMQWCQRRRSFQSDSERQAASSLLRSCQQDRRAHRGTTLRDTNFPFLQDLHREWVGGHR